MEFVKAVTAFYQLLITIGHWPLDSISLPPATGWDSTAINVSRAQELGYSDRAIELIRHLPYPNEEVYYREECDVLGECTVLNLKSHRDLERARDFGYEKDVPLEGSLFLIMSHRVPSGIDVAINVDTGMLSQFLM